MILYSKIHLMKSYFQEIEKKLKKNIQSESLEIIDNSYLHKSHKSFSPDKFHLHLKIKSSYLSSISKINAHKLIMNILKDDLKDKIHALEISIEQ